MISSIVKSVRLVNLGTTAVYNYSLMAYYLFKGFIWSQNSSDAGITKSAEEMEKILNGKHAELASDAYNKAKLHGCYASLSLLTAYTIYSDQTTNPIENVVEVSSLGTNCYLMQKELSESIFRKAKVF